MSLEESAATTKRIMCENRLSFNVTRSLTYVFGKPLSSDTIKSLIASGNNVKEE